MNEKEAVMEEEKNDGVSSSDSSNPCPICLGPVQQESYLDQCFHRFCYTCILRWSKVANCRHSQPPSSVKCPLCKAENISVIHGYDGSSFQRHYINQAIGNSAFFSKLHKYRLQCYYIKLGASADKFNVSRYWKSNKYLLQNKWLFDWLRREIQALTQEEDVEIIVHHIIGSIPSTRRTGEKFPRDSPETKREEFKASVSQAARPYVAGRTDQFVEELELFLASGLNIEAYDKVYIRHLGWKIPEITNEDDEEEEFHKQSPLVPSLNLFDDDSD